MPDIGSLQLEIIKNAKSLIKKFDKDKYKPKKNSIFYLATYANSIGLVTLKSLVKVNENFISKSYVILKDIFYSSYYNSNFSYPSKTINKYNKIVVSWANKNNFEKNGTYKDKFFNINSKNNKNILWYLIYVDNVFPNKIAENIVLFQPIKKKFFNPFFIIKYFLQKFYYIVHGLRYFLTSLSSHSYLGEVVVGSFKNYYNSDVKTIIMPFEGQPFQNELIRYVKKLNLKTKVIGYMHAAPLPVPTNLIYKNHSPDEIIVNGQDQLKCFKKLLGWNKKNIKLKPSYRFLKQNKPENNKIYLPANIRKPKIILESLDFLSKNYLINLSKYKVKKHPASSNSNYCDMLINQINKLKKYKKINSKIKFNDAIIFIGVTGGVIEALERNLNVLHIIEDPIFDLYTNEIWPNVKSFKLNENIYKYKIKKKGQLIKLGRGFNSRLESLT